MDLLPRKLVLVSPVCLHIVKLADLILLHVCCEYLYLLVNSHAVCLSDSLTTDNHCIVIVKAWGAQHMLDDYVLKLTVSMSIHCQDMQPIYSRAPLIRTPLGPFQVSCLVRCPVGPATTVLFIEVSLFQRVLISGFHCIAKLAHP